MTRTAFRRPLRRLTAALGAAALLLWPASAALAAAEGSIDHAEPRNGGLRLLYSLPGLPQGSTPDLSTLRVTMNGRPSEASAQMASSAEADTRVRRTTILAIDVSNSMRGERFTEAKRAAHAFLQSAPADLYIGIVTFASTVETVQQPSLDRAESAALIDGLTLSPQTSLYNGVRGAVEAAGVEGQRSVLVLSDGRDTTRASLDDLTALIEDRGVKVDVVALAQSPADRGPLQQMADAGSGTLLTADDPGALTALFSSEAAALAQQILVTATVPEGLTANEASVSVSVEADGETYTDTAFLPVLAAAEQPKETETAPSPPQPAPAPGFMVPAGVMVAGLVGAGVAVLFVLLVALGVFDRQRTETLEERIAAYTKAGTARAAAGTPGVRLAQPARPEGITASAVDIAEKALTSSRGLEATLSARLEAAAVALKPAEWLLAHAGIAFGAGLLGLLVSSGSILVTLLLLVLGAVLPWIYLGMKRSRRLKAFNGQLAQTLQLMSGSLSAGLSLAQSIDTVVREGTEPVSGEFRRALVEARLGVQIEDTLDSVAKRMDSQDFEWVVMAIKIQREVGGNLAELLLGVAATMRERDYLRRQVKTLSAEGRLSAWILGGLPPGFVAYLSIANPSYLEPMFSSPMGWMMLGVAATMLAVGIFWMSKMVKVEV